MRFLAKMAMLGVMLAFAAGNVRAEDAPALTPDQQIIMGLSQQGTALQQEALSIKTKVAELAKTKARLTSRSEEGAKAFAKVQEMDRDLSARASLVAARVAQHNAGAGVPAESDAEADAFNSESAALNSEREAMLKEADNIEALGKGLLEGRDQINKEVLAWTQSIKDTQARMATFEEKRKTFNARVLSVLEDLKKRHAMSKECAGDVPLERAHECLREVWDGTK